MTKLRTSPVLIVMLILAGALGVACAYAGAELRYSSKMMTFDFFGLHMTTKQAGTALFSLGLVICILAFRKAVKTFIGVPLFLRK